MVTTVGSSIVMQDLGSCVGIWISTNLVITSLSLGFALFARFVWFLLFLTSF
jgi:hypothetical protein